VALITPGRRLAAAVLVAGIGLTWLAQAISSAPTAPLFDGVFIEDPYRYVNPPAGEDGDPFPAEFTEQVTDGAVPLLAVATAEVPPQAQIIAQADAFEISSDVSSITVSIVPSAPSDPDLVGNVYTISITDQAGSALTIRPGALVTLVLRAPLPDLPAQVARFDGTRWVPLPSEHGGLPTLFAANIDQPGDFAVLLTGPIPSQSAGSASPAPSGGGGGPIPDGGTPTWVIVLLAIAAVGVGLAWGLFADGERR
jgi:hypothetical protein